MGTFGIVEAKRSSHKSKPQASQVTSAPTLSIAPEEFSYLAGSTVEQNDVRVTDRQFAIVEQDGTGGQPNPSVNLYGTHLTVKNDFKVSASMSQIVGDASFRLYGAVPIIQDEFRVETPSIEFKTTKTGVTINIWDGSESSNLATSPPTSSTTYPLSLTDSLNFEIRRISDNFEIVANGATLATIPDSGIFNKGTVWFGATSQGGSYLLSNIQAVGLNGGSVERVDTSTASVSPDITGTTLQAMAAKKRPGFFVGAAMALPPSVSDSQYNQVAFGGNFGMMTTENALKWQFVHPQPDVYDFHESDALVQLAKKNGMAVHGHTLVFGEANPSWVQNLPISTSSQKLAVSKVMTDHIETVAGHYKGQMASWDVINEPLADYDNFDTSTNKTLRENIWYKALGESYITTAFMTARQVDPSAKLYINEYGLESSGERWNVFLQLVTKLKKAGVPIDGVGFQAHVYEAADKINVTTLKLHMQQLAKLGIESRISEMDVYDDDGTAVQAKQYLDVFNACINEPSCKSWTSWGVSDKYDMFQEDGVVNYGHDFLWDDKLRPTRALTQILTSLK